ncbi:hypothetical protein IVB15_11690 [Bradyrhizobium sp. 182]|nr:MULTISPECIES: hypothetical protein [unclassified Bradyrhizobium]MCK1420325.1 hypothetical protein [Bradyrhizobium sp. CW12]MCK1528372.1 hypothetical protein [Bradyrhizobium sp. 182]MCK1649369.1 hypothetical protein [Bradyrhizobium sp. 154]MCK1663551.1 hypothetical protein [Bradyrhizobium sp. 153]
MDDSKRQPRQDVKAAILKTRAEVELLKSTIDCHSAHCLTPIGAEG